MPPKFSKEFKIQLVSGQKPIRQHRTSPCEANCPAGNPIQAMENHLKEGRRDEAHALLLTRNPFPGVTGRVCPHPCEQNCNRNRYDEGLAVRSLERFAADSNGVAPLRPGAPTGKHLAVIGSGPAGMTCAYFAALLGHRVSVFESAPVLGGVPRTAVPDFRLPKGVVDRETGNILALGIEAYINTVVGKHIGIEQIMQDHDACVVAVGNWTERRLNIPGAERARPAVAFLKESNLSRPDFTGLKVLVIGGGGVAFDCAFTARRLGAAAVSLLFPEDAEHIKAPAEEVAQARREGLVLHASRLARRIDERGVEAVKLESFAFDEKGELEAKTIEDDVLQEPADVVICASGLQPALDFLAPLNPARTPRGHLVVDSDMATSVPGLFAAGDIVDGPGTVAAAIGSGRRTALGLHSRLMDLPDRLMVQVDAERRLVVSGVSPDGQAHVVDFSEISNPGYHEKAPRRESRQAQASSLPFSEIDAGFDAEAAQAEAGRCLHCGHCINCGTCVERCPGYILVKDEQEGPFVEYPDECWHCGCCRIGCPTGAISIEFPITMRV